MVQHPRVRTAAVAVVATLLVVGAQWISPQAHSVPAASPECQLLEPLESTTLYQVPEGVDRVLLEAYGTSGDPSSTNPVPAATGRGVTLIGWIGVTQGDWLSSNGASWFRRVGSDDVPVLEAGSGGAPAPVLDAAGRPVLDASGNQVFAAGGDAALPGQSAQPGSGPGGGGGAPTVGGTAGVVHAGSGTSYSDGSAGAAYRGGDGGSAYVAAIDYSVTGGRGGDGHFGGGGGAASSPASGGGGGSSYVAPEVTLTTVTLQTSPLATHVSTRAYACSPMPPAVTAFTTPMTRLGYVCTGPKAYPYVGVPADFTVPAGEQFALIEAIGALGGGEHTVVGDSGGAGGAATGVLAVTGGQVLQVRVGGAGSMDRGATTADVPGGYNGGGDAMRGSLDLWTTRASGGGASDVRVAPYGLTQRVVVGGGGGAGDSYNQIAGGSGGKTGGNGTIQPLNVPASEADINAVIAARQPLLAGTGGTSRGPGVNGLYSQETLSIYKLARVDETEPNPARDPAAGIGGDATASGILPGRGIPRFSSYLGGGGGWYGGGLYVQGGHEVQEDVALGGGGGGGSSYAVASPASLPAAVFSDGVQHGDGLVWIATCHRGAKPVSTEKPASTRRTTPTLEATASPSTDLPSITPVVSSVGAGLTDSGSPSPGRSGDASKTAEAAVPGAAQGEPTPWWPLAVALGVLGAAVAFFVLVRRRRRAQ